METRKAILDFLELYAGEFVSGEQISDKLGISRAAVWKHVRALKESGAKIESVTRKGHRLLQSPDGMDASAIAPLLTTRELGRHVVFLPQVPSTNAIAKECARQGVHSGTVVTTDYQSEGRGRRGRDWIVEPSKDVTMSMILRPPIETRHAARFTFATALGVHDMLSKWGIHAEIKWPNDVLVGGKKISGILLELEGAIDALDAIIVGLGVNVNTSKFGDEITQSATSLSSLLGRTVPRREVAAMLLNALEKTFDACLTDESFECLLDEYRTKCSTLGKDVNVVAINETYEGYAVDVTSDGRLLVRTSSGEVKTVGAADVSIRAKKQ